MAREPPVVVLDANVLFPFQVGHLLAFASFHGLIDARWTDAIEIEWVENAVARHGETERAGIESRRDAMNAAMPSAKIVGYEHLLPGIDFPDKDDAHVVAAAIHAGAEAIVTRDKAFFVVGALAHGRVRAVDPDELLHEVAQAEPAWFLSMIDEARRALATTAPDRKTYSGMLERAGLPSIARWLRHQSDLLAIG